MTFTELLHKILHTIGGKVTLGVGNLILLLITTRWLGPETKGEISLFVLNVSFIVIVSGFVSGPSLVYLGTRINRSAILFYTFAWAAIASFIVSAICYLVGTVPRGAFLLLLAAGFTESVLSAHLMLLLSREEIARHNTIQVFKLMLTLAILICLVKGGGFDGFKSFAYAFLISTCVSLAWVGWGGKLSFQGGREGRGHLWKLVGLGAVNQIGNLAQLINYRLALYVIEFFAVSQALANAKIGIYSTALQIAEIIWLVSRSISMVQYARIANLEDNREEALQVTYDLIKVSFITTTAIALALLAFPAEWYVGVLGAGFSEVRGLVLILLPGIIFFTISGGLSHLSSGLGLHRLNMATSIFGAVLSIPGYLFAYKFYGMEGLAIGASLIYFLQTFFQVWLIRPQTGFQVKKLVPSKPDVKRLFSLFG